jgi:hypothetical protein
MRKVIYKRWISSHESETGKGMWSEERSGTFHQWGTEITEFETGFVQASVGIVEDEINCTVHLIHPEYIKFREGV